MNFKIFYHITNVRNATVKQMLAELASQDADGDGLSNAGGPIGPKSELVDQLPKVIEIEITPHNGVVSKVKVLPAWRDRNVLNIHLTEDNLALMLEAPPEDVKRAPFTPTIESPNVTWVGKRSHCRIEYYDPRRSRYRYKSEYVEFEPDMSDQVKQELASQAADKLQDFYNEHHAHPCEPMAEPES